MSIIHDALKKVQQGLKPNSDKTDSSPAAPKPESSGYLYETNVPVETLKPVERQPAVQKTSMANSIKSVLALICAMAITIGAGWYVYHQFRNNIPHLQRLAKRSFYKLIHKEEVPDFKTKAPEDLVPLAKITVTPPKPVAVINPPAPSIALKSTTPTNPSAPLLPTSSTASTPTLPAITDTVKPNAPVTLNIHGVMSNGSSNLALINDQVYQEGDDVDGVKIVKISLHSITVIDNGEEKTIRVKN